MRGSYNNPIIMIIRPTQWSSVHKTMLSLGWQRGRGAWFKNDVWVKDIWVTK